MRDFEAYASVFFLGFGANFVNLFQPNFFEFFCFSSVYSTRCLGFFLQTFNITKLKKIK